MKITQKEIESFFAVKKIAIAGVSRDSKKFGRQVFIELTSRGYDIYPINPNTQTIGGLPCFQSIKELPNDVKNLVIITPKRETEAIVKEAVQKGIPNIWIQQTSETPESIRYAEERNVKVIHHECILMWTTPINGVHKFHKTIKKLFGRLPKYE